MKWTNEEIKLLEELYSSELTIEEIAEYFPGRSINAIRLKASRMGFKRPVTLLTIQYSNGLLYDPEKNTIRVLKPISTEELLRKIYELKKKDWTQGG